MLLLTSEETAELATPADVNGWVEDAYEQLGRGLATDDHRGNISSPAVPGRLKGHRAISPSGLGGYFTAVGYWSRPPATDPVIDTDTPRKLFVLFDEETGELLCTLVPDRLSWLRTGATGAVATDHCAREDASTLGIIGAGRQGRAQLLSIAAVRDLEDVYVYSRTEDSREAFARELEERGDYRIHPVDSARQAVAGVDIVSTTTTSPHPVLRGDWLDPGTHVNTIGAHYPDEREVDSVAIQRSRVIVDSMHRAERMEGELLIPALAGKFDWAEAIELGDVVVGNAPGRTSEDDITLATSGGLAIEMLVPARRLYERAVSQGVGTSVAMS